MTTNSLVLVLLTIAVMFNTIFLNPNIVVSG